ncbi:MAG: long-chain fatty acid--CoA ligase [Polyangiales bacterium]
MSVDTIPARLFQQAKTRPSAPAYYVREGGVWKSTSWATYAAEVKQAAKALVKLGFRPGQCTSILGQNRPEWCIFHVATMAVGGAPAGIYTTNSPEEVAYIVDHSESPVVLVENHDQWKKIDAQRENLPRLKKVVLMQGAGKVDDELVLTWEEFLALGEGIDDDEITQRLHALEPSGLATLIYTSGTTGPPKGVMLSHSNVAKTAGTAASMTGMSASDWTLSYLPLSHIAEQMFTIHGPITAGSRVYFSEGIQRLRENLQEVQPTVFFGVPRVWEKFYSAVSTKLGAAEGAKKKLADWALGVGRRATAQRARGGRVDDVEYQLAKKLIFDKVKPALGMSNARICVSGAAPISPEILEFFAGLDLAILEVYGQSEDCGPTTFNFPNQFRFGSVGTYIPEVDVRIADDGEILVKGPNVFLGYYKDKQATSETLADGWLHSGDLGEFRDGFLYITGRKKDILITAGGKNIAPKNLESELKQHPAVGEAVVIGDRRPYLTALISLDVEALPTYCGERGIDLATAHENGRLRSDIQDAVDKMNAKVARVEQVKKFVILPRPLSIETGELTPTMKVKRKIVNEKWAHLIDQMYAGHESGD